MFIFSYHKHFSVNAKQEYENPKQLTVPLNKESSTYIHYDEEKHISTTLSLVHSELQRWINTYTSPKCSQDTRKQLYCLLKSKQNQSWKSVASVQYSRNSYLFTRLTLPHTNEGRANQNNTRKHVIQSDYRDWTVNIVDVQCVCHTGDSRSRDLSEGDVILLREWDTGNELRPAKRWDHLTVSKL